MSDIELPNVRVQFKEWTCKVYIGRYHYPPNLMLRLVDATDGIPVASATTNHEDIILPDTHVCIKNYSENIGMVEALQAAGIIGPNPVFELHGQFTEYPVYQLTIAFAVPPLPPRPKNKK